MSLFTDTHVSNEEILLTFDPEVDAVLNATGSRGNERRITLTLSGEAGILSRAWSECRSRLEAALATFSTFAGPPGAGGHLALLWGLNGRYGNSGTLGQIRLTQITTHDAYYRNSLSPLQQWVTYCALRLLFQSASLHFAVSDNKKGDRYRQKEEHYARLAENVWQQLLASGVPYVYAYLSCPGALHDFNAGVWDNSNLSFADDVNQTNTDNQEVRVAITYIDKGVYLSPDNKNNGESAPSAILSTDIPAGQLLTVDISTLNPQTPLAESSTLYSQGVATATHWLVYVGQDQPDAPLWLQGQPIPISQSSITLPPVLTTSGAALGNGQMPVSNLSFGMRCQRG